VIGPGRAELAVPKDRINIHDLATSRMLASAALRYVEHRESAARLATRTASPTSGRGVGRPRRLRIRAWLRSLSVTDRQQEPAQVSADLRRQLHYADQDIKRAYLGAMAFRPSLGLRLRVPVGAPGLGVSSSSSGVRGASRGRAGGARWWPPRGPARRHRRAGRPRALGPGMAPGPFSTFEFSL